MGICSSCEIDTNDSFETCHRRDDWCECHPEYTRNFNKIQPNCSHCYNEYYEPPYNPEYIYNVNHRKNHLE